MQIVNVKQNAIVVKQKQRNKDVNVRHVNVKNVRQIAMNVNVVIECICCRV